MSRYVIVLLAFLLSVSSAFDCLHHMCTAAFKACNHSAESHDDTKECWERADETFHCCQDCEKCDVGTQECHAQLCDKVFGICTGINSNSTDCQNIADEASHCCSTCLQCPAAHTKPHHSKPLECHGKFCSSVFKACKDSDDPHIECMQVADNAAGCCDACDACQTEEECDVNMCNKIVTTCTQHHPQNSSLCCERADSAAHCCNNCMECSSNEKPPKARYDHCLIDLCNDVYLHCINADHSSDNCRTLANHASECCAMCTDCNQS